MSRRLLVLPALILVTTLLMAFPPQSSLDRVEGLLDADDIDGAAEALRDITVTPAALALQGEVAFRRGDFSQARTLYQTALRRDRRTARAHFGMGRLALARMRTTEAIGHFQRAITFDGKKPLYRLLAADAYGMARKYTAQKAELESYLRLSPVDTDRAVEARAALTVMEKMGTAGIGVVTAPTAPRPIPLSKSLNLLFTQVMVNGEGPFEIVVDTGASQTVLSRKLVDRLGLQPLTTTLIHGVGGTGKAESSVYQLDRISVGDVAVANLPAGTFSDPLLTQLADGILGTAMFSDFIVTIDMPAGTLSLSKAPVPAGRVNDAWIINNLILLAAGVNSTHTGNFILDTGAVATVLSHRLAAHLGVTEDTPGARLDTGLTGVGGLQGSVLRIEDVTLEVPGARGAFGQVVSIDTRSISKMMTTEVSGVLGYDFLEDYKVVIDYTMAEVRFLP